MQSVHVYNHGDNKGYVKNCAFSGIIYTLTELFESGPSPASLICQLHNVIPATKLVERDFNVRKSEIGYALVCTATMALPGKPSHRLEWLDGAGHGIVMQVHGDDICIFAYIVEQSPQSYLESWVLTPDYNVCAIHYRGKCSDAELAISKLKNLITINEKLGITDEPQYTDAIYISSKLSDFLDVEADEKISRADVYRAIDTYIRNDDIHGQWEQMVGATTTRLEDDVVVMDDELMDLVGMDHSNTTFEEICKRLEMHFFDIN